MAKGGNSHDEVNPFHKRLRAYRERAKLPNPHDGRDTPLTRERFADELRDLLRSPDDYPALKTVETWEIKDVKLPRPVLIAIIAVLVKWRGIVELEEADALLASEPFKYARLTPEERATAFALERQTFPPSAPAAADLVALTGAPAEAEAAPAQKNTRRKPTTMLLLGGACIAVLALMLLFQNGLSLLDVSSTPVVTPASTIAPTNTAMPATAAVPTNTIAPTSVATETLDTNTLSVVGICGYQPRIVPPALDLDQGGEGALTQIGVNYPAFVNQACKGPFAIAPIAKDGSRDVTLEIYASNEGAGNRWIQVEDEFMINVVAEPLADSVYPAVARSVGSTGTMWFFGPTSLNTDSDSYKNRLPVLDAQGEQPDFFTLQPGEFEGFTLPLRCDAPGLYRVTITIPYRIGDKPGLYEYRPQAIMCPPKFFVWVVDGPIDQEVVQPDEFLAVYRDGDYTWNGTGYDLAPSNSSPAATP